jgi:carbonic anhydrase/acetyltransferase-like protein (isoleucine patch superfamily)
MQHRKCEEEFFNMADIEFNPELIAADAWIAPNATVRGTVNIGARSSVWFGAVLRGDVEPISIGEDTNVQDLCCLHGDPGYACRLGNRVTVGHGAVVHGATVEDESLIGMRAVLLNGARIGEHCIVGSGALVAEGKVIPPRSLVVGTPARVVREVSDEEVLKLQESARKYAQAAAAYGRSIQSASEGVS